MVGGSGVRGGLIFGGIDGGGALLLVITILYITIRIPLLTPLPTLYPDISPFREVGGG